MCLQRVPAVVATRLDQINLLPGVLADLASPQIAGFAVKGNTPRVSETVGPDLRALAVGRPGERVVGRDCVFEVIDRPININSDDRAEQRRRVLYWPIQMGASAMLTLREAETLCLPHLNNPPATESSLLKGSRHRVRGLVHVWSTGRVVSGMNR